MYTISVRFGIFPQTAIDGCSIESRTLHLVATAGLLCIKNGGTAGLVQEVYYTVEQMDALTGRV